MLTASGLEPALEEYQMTAQSSLREVGASRAPGRPNKAMVAFAVGAAAMGAVAIGAVAVGAVAIGALAIGKLTTRHLRIERAQFKSLEVHDLVVTALRVVDEQVSG